MKENKSLVEQLKKLHKNIDDLKNVEVKVDDDDNNLTLLSLIHIFFEHFKDAFFMVRKILLLLMKSCDCEIQGIFNGKRC